MQHQQLNQTPNQQKQTNHQGKLLHQLQKVAPPQIRTQCNQKEIRDIYKDGSGLVYADDNVYLRVNTNNHLTYG